jgi:photosystem II stability/assembly factor-like uncharacterized protein
MKTIKLIFFVLFLLFFYSFGSAQNIWVQQNSGTTYKLSAMSFINPNNGFICGYQSTIIKTTNGGNNWIPVTAPLNNYLDIFMVSENIVIAGGIVPQLIRTTNAGLNWTIIDTGHVSSMQFINSQTGWIASTKVLKTTNGGLNWTRYNLYNNRMPYGVYFSDSQTGYAYGEVSETPWHYSHFVQKSVNGGANWSEVLYIPNMGTTIFHGIYFINANTGFIGGFGSVFKTVNGFQNWIEYLTPGIYAVTNFFFINSSTGWVVSDLSFTTNTGVNWTKSINGYFNDVQFVNPLTGWVCGEGGIIYKTTTGGISAVNLQGEEVPVEFNLYQNYPNPFNPATMIKFIIPENGKAKMKNDKTILKVFDLIGKEVATLVNEKLKAGTYEVMFDGSNLPSGIYFYQLNAGNFLETKKLILLK